MNTTFSCPLCGKQTNSFVLDRRNDHFCRCLCNNNNCTVSHFTSCWLCACEYPYNTGICVNWYHDHLKRKKHKEHARNLEATFRNNDTDYSFASNDCNELLNSNVDYNEVEQNNDSSTIPIIIGNNQDTLSSIDILSFNDDNEVSNVDDDNDDNNLINNTTTIINECNNNESVTIHDDNEVSNNNNDKI